MRLCNGLNGRCCPERLPNNVCRSLPFLPFPRSFYNQPSIGHLILKLGAGGQENRENNPSVKPNDVVYDSTSFSFQLPSYSCTFSRLTRQHLTQTALAISRTENRWRLGKVEDRPSRYKSGKISAWNNMHTCHFASDQRWRGSAK